MDWRVPLCRPTFREEELEALLNAYRSGWLTIGPRTDELESAFRAYTGARHAVALSSCSAALHLASLGARLGPGDEVVVPSLTFVSTVSAIAHTGATPRFAEIAGLTEPWLSAAAVEQAIGERTKAIVTTAYGGHPGEIAEIGEIAKQRGLALIEDAAHACGSRHGGRHIGTFGLAGAFSFSASKNIGIGEGGMLVTDDDELAQRVSRGRWHGVSSSIWDRHRQTTPQYELGELGFNYRFDDPRAALVHARLRHLDDDNRRRAEIDAAYRRGLDQLESIEPTAPPPAGEAASHCLFTAVLGKHVDRDRFRESLANRGVQTSVHYPPVHMSGAFAQPNIRLPLTEDYAARSVTLPMFPEMTGWQQELVVEAVNEALGGTPRISAAA